MVICQILGGRKLYFDICKELLFFKRLPYTLYYTWSYVNVSYSWYILLSCAKVPLGSTDLQQTVTNLFGFGWSDDYEEAVLWRTCRWGKRNSIWLLRWNFDNKEAYSHHCWMCRWKQRERCFYRAYFLYCTPISSDAEYSSWLSLPCHQDWCCVQQTM